LNFEFNDMVQQRIRENKRGGKFGGGMERKPAEYEQKIVDIRRVARVVKGGRRFNFRVTLIIGNKKGDVGVGIGKAEDTGAAMEKASRDARKNLIKVSLTAAGSIPHETEGKFASARVFIKPVSGGRGLIAGGSVRTVLDLAGVKGASAKILSTSKNKLNNARATIEALKKLKA
jgi:small subunit ribosomal protein S5